MILIIIVAPEIIMRVNYTLSVDWWSLGIVVFEFLDGATPFKSSDSSQTYLNIVDGSITWSKRISSIAKVGS